MPVLVMVLKQIKSEIVVQMSPYGVDMVGIVLHIVIFNKERMSM